MKGSFKARVDFTDDPEDVYRINVPARTTLTVTMKPDANITLELWGPGTTTVNETGAARLRDLLGVSARPGAQAETIRWTNKGKKAVVVYSDTYFPTKSTALNADYTLTVKTARARP